MRTRHGSTGDGVGRLISAVPCRVNAESWSEDVHAFAMIRKVSPFIAEGGCADSHSIHCTSGRIIASVLVIAAICQKGLSRCRRHLLSSRNSKVKTSRDSRIDSVIERLGFTATERHIGDGPFVLGLAGSSELFHGGGSS